MARTEAKRLRAAIKALGKRGRTEAYPMAVRNRLLGYWKKERAAGRSRASVAADVGLHPNTFRNWEGGSGGGRSKQTTKARAKLVPVRIRADRKKEPTAVAVIVSPSGYRLEGLSVAAAVQALRDLS